MKTTRRSLFLIALAAVLRPFRAREECLALDWGAALRADEASEG